MKFNTCVRCTWAFVQVLSTGFWSHQNTTEKVEEEERMGECTNKQDDDDDDEKKLWFLKLFPWNCTHHFGFQNERGPLVHPFLVFIVIMQNGISNAWQLLKFYHAAIIGAYITEHNIAMQLCCMYVCVRVCVCVRYRFAPSQYRIFRSVFHTDTHLIYI